MITTISLVLITAGLAYLYLNSGGSYLPAWMTVLILALLVFASLSIPRYMIISPTAVEIHCVVELTTTPYEDIISVRLMEQKEMKWAVPVPLLGIYGFFGYYGYFINLRRGRIFKVYSRKWNNFVMIENIYEDLIVVSADDPEKFISEVAGHMDSGERSGAG